MRAFDEIRFLGLDWMMPYACKFGKNVDNAFRYLVAGVDWIVRFTIVRCGCVIRILGMEG